MFADDNDIGMPWVRRTVSLSHMQAQRQSGELVRGRESYKRLGHDGTLSGMMGRFREPEPSRRRINRTLKPGWGWEGECLVVVQ